MIGKRHRLWPLIAVALTLTTGPEVHGQAAQQQPFEPHSGQAGKDVVWVPTPAALVERMLDVAQVTANDFVMDLGSGDGRNIIAAAKRGARALGVEFNPDMVELSRRNAASAGVSDKATFVEGDMYEADISKADVLALFLLPANLERLTEKFLDMRPGSRIVDNTFGIPGWTPDVTERIDAADCSAWCTALLWIVPAKVAGTWRSDQGDLTLTQAFQIVTGTVATPGREAVPLENGRLRGESITFSAAGAEYTGRVVQGQISGVITSDGRDRPWRATRRE